MRVPGLCLSILAAILTAAPIAAAPDAERSDERAIVELVPREPPSGSWSHVFAPLTSLFRGGTGYWYDPRVVEVETRPPGALLDFFYVRQNFQKRFEQARAPVTLVLPSRLDATPRDSVVIRATLDGHRREEVRVEVRSRTERVTLELAPLPNALLAFTHTCFAGRGALTFLTEQAADFRVQSTQTGFRVILLGTRIAPDARVNLASAPSALVDSLRADQIGEDLIVSAEFAERASGDPFAPRRRQAEDFVRGVHVLSVEFAAGEEEAVHVERARDALARIGSDRVTGCALAFDAHLRDALDAAVLLRALAPSGAYTDRFTRAAMKRLGEISPGGVIHMRDGGQFRGAIAVELSAAMAQPGDAVGYLALLRTFVAELEPEANPNRRSALRSLIAPELDASQFDAIVEEAERLESDCADSEAARAAPVSSG